MQHPLYAERQLPVILGEHVSAEDGTGAVHTAPGHGAEDFAVGRAYGLVDKFPANVLNPVDARGVYLPGTPLLEGQHIWKANDVLVEMLRGNGHLLAFEEIEHSYPHCWRHKTPVAFRATPQWFISMDKEKLREHALSAIDTVEWIPSWGRERIAGMVEGRPDWCISRQRVWGVPIALFVHKATHEPHPRSVELLEQVAERVAEGGIEAWEALDPAELLGEEADDYEKVTDVLDVWFDSGVTHYAVLDRRPALQQGDAESRTVMYLEGSDQHRGWFQSSLLTSVAMHSRAPYQRVLTHGFAVDADGRKMSKSVGNVVAPQKVMDTLGADVLRLWVAAADYRNEMSVSEEILKRVSDSYRRIRNTCKFLLGNLHGFDPETDLLPVAECLPLDQWAVQGAYDVQAVVTAPTTARTSPRWRSACRTSAATRWARCTWTSSRTVCTPCRPTAMAGAARRARCTASPRRWCAGWRRCSPSPPRRCGSRCRASAAERAVRDLVRRAGSEAGQRRAAQLVGRPAGHCAARRRGCWKACDRAATSAPRCRPR